MTRHRINTTTTTGNARTLRTDMTDVERMLWRAIRGKQLHDCRFRRQHPIGKYIADFACPDQKLIVELDGGQHQEQLVYDEARTEFLQAQGWRVLRFWNNDVLNNLEGVLAKVVETLTSLPPSLGGPPNLPPCRGKEPNQVSERFWSKFEPHTTQRLDRPQPQKRLASVHADAAS